MYLACTCKKESQKPQEHTSDYVKVSWEHVARPPSYNLPVYIMGPTFCIPPTSTPPNPLGGPDHVHDTGARVGCSWV